jgi:hypothetical protein
MPRASWRGFLRLSLVSCPIYLSPATTRTKPIRLHQVWQPAPADVGEDDLPDWSGGQQGSAPSVTRLRADNASADGDESSAATRIMLRPYDPGTGEGAGLTGSPDESGARRREQGLARAGNARVRRAMIQLAWRFLMFQKESALHCGIAPAPLIAVVARARP